MQDSNHKSEGGLILESLSVGAEDAKFKIYELGYLLVSTVSSEDMSVHHADLKNLIVSLGGNIFSDEIPKEINLAYTMTKVAQNVRSKFNTAYFGSIKFETTGENVLELKKKLDANPSLIRFILFKTVKESGVVSRRFSQKDFRNKSLIARKEKNKEPSLPINKEEIDKEIDALVVSSSV